MRLQPAAASGIGGSSAAPEATAVFRTIALGLMAWVGTASASDPLPPAAPKILSTELDALQKERKAAQDEVVVDPTGGDRVKLRAQLLDMIRLLGEKKNPEVVPVKPKELPELPKTKFELPESGAIDTLRMAQNLYKAGDLEAARLAFKQLEEKAGTEDRLFVQYMLASCLRKQGKSSEAAVLYREVAEAKDDAFLKESALWQLSMLKSSQELESQLEQLRSRKKTR